MCREDNLNRRLVGIDVEASIGTKELHEVHAGEVAGGVVDVHVLGARVRSIDAVSIRRRVPLVNGRVELQTRVRTLPSSARNLAPDVASFHRAKWRAIGASVEVPICVVEDGLHELVRDAHRVVGVLVLDGVNVCTVKVHVETIVTKNASLLFFLGLAPDEFFNVRVINVQDDHLRGATSLATRLDGAR